MHHIDLHVYEYICVNIRYMYTIPSNIHMYAYISTQVHTCAHIKHINSQVHVHGHAFKYIYTRIYAHEYINTSMCELTYIMLEQTSYHRNSFCIPTRTYERVFACVCKGGCPRR
jgi:hypothetical protein